MPRAAKKPTQKVGSLWSFDVGLLSIEPVGGRLFEIVRPDGATASVRPWNGRVAHTLDIPGIYRCGDEEVTAK